MRNQIIQGDIRQVAKEMPSQSVNCIVTSPSYYGLRDYGHADQIGLEETPQEYIETMVRVFRELRRVLRDDGTLWLVIGDSYSGSGRGRNADGTHSVGESIQSTNRGTINGRLFKTVANVQPQCTTNQKIQHTTTPPKNLLGIPWRVALALQDDGWILRSDIIWSKSNPMPESVADRPTKSHEYIFMFAKSQRYFYDQDAIKEPAAEAGKIVSLGEKSFSKGQAVGKGVTPSGNGLGSEYQVKEYRNKRSVWNLPTRNYKEAHFAVFPPALILPPILAGCPARTCSECGAPWVRVVEKTISHSLQAGNDWQEGRFSTNHHGPSRPGSLVGHTSETTGFEPTCNCNAPTTPGVVLDPFMGSGTVAQVAIENGRDWLGVELNPDYIELANKRIAQAQPALMPVGG